MENDQLHRPRFGTVRLRSVGPVEVREYGVRGAERHLGDVREAARDGGRSPFAGDGSGDLRGGDAGTDERMPIRKVDEWSFWLGAFAGALVMGVAIVLAVWMGRP